MAPHKASLLRFVFNKASVPLTDNVGLPRDDNDGGEDDDHAELSPTNEIPKLKKHLDRTNTNWKAKDNHRTAINHHPRLKDLRSTDQLLKEAASSFFANIVTFLFLSLLILSFRTVVENGTTYVTSFIYHDPSLKALLSCLDLAGNTNSNCFRSPKDPSSATFHRHRHSPFLHLTCVGTLDGDFFSSGDDDGRSLFGPNEKSSVNGSFVFFGLFNLKSGFLDLVIDNGIRVWEVVFITRMVAD